MKGGFYWKRGRQKRGRYNGPFDTLEECKAAAAKNGRGHDIIIGEMMWQPVPMPNALLVIENVAAALRAWMVSDAIPNAIAVIEEVEVIKAKTGKDKP